MPDVVTLVALTSISDPALAMRSAFDFDAVQELADSIKAIGLINPITVRPLATGYEVVAGHRRFKACQLIGLTEVPCVVRTLTDNEVVEIMAAENLERQDVDPVDEALFVGRLLNLPNANIEDVAKRVNRSRGWVEARLEILDYPEYLVAALKQGQIKLGVAGWLGKITDDQYRKMYVTSAVKNGMSVLQAQYAFNQFEVGAMPNVDALIPPPSEFPASERPMTRAMCARCNTVAVEPNLRMVWVHINCDQVAPPTGIEPSPSPETTAPAPA